MYGILKRGEISYWKIGKFESRKHIDMVLKFFNPLTLITRVLLGEVKCQFADI